MSSTIKMLTFATSYGIWFRSIFASCTVILAIVSTALSRDFGNVPAVDQCHDINATEPDQCPTHIGPPCPPCYTNMAADYVDADSLSFNPEEQKSLQDFMDWYLGWWPNNYPPTNSAAPGGYNIFSGLAGRANIYLRVYQHTGNATLLNIATEYIGHALSSLPDANQQEHASYMSGNIGVWFLKSQIDSENSDWKSMDHYLNLIYETFKSVDAAIINNESTASNGLDVVGDCTLDTGLSGMLYGALLVNTLSLRHVIDRDIIARLVYHILDIGIATAQRLQTDYLQYFSFDDCYLYGPGYGSSGIIKSIFTAYDMYPEQLDQLFNVSSPYYTALTNTIKFYSSIQLDDGNMPTNVEGGCSKHYGTDIDARVQWCHGAPGFIGIFLEASRLWAGIDNDLSTQFMHNGIAAIDATWNRGLLTKGTMFCHGIGGNINMLWEASDILRKMDNQKLARKAAWRAKQFILWTLDWDNINATRLYQSDTAYSMLQGNFAIPMIYIEALEDDWYMKSACHPGWNLCL